MHLRRPCRRGGATALALLMALSAGGPGCYLGWDIERVEEKRPEELLERRIVARRVTRLELPGPPRLLVQEQLEERHRQVTAWRDPSLAFEPDGLLFALGVLWLIFDQEGGVPYSVYGALLILVSPLVDLPALVGSLLFTPVAGPIDLAMTPDQGEDVREWETRPLEPVRDTAVLLRAAGVEWEGRTDREGVLHLPAHVAGAGQAELCWRSGEEEAVVRFTLTR